jgi:glucose-6-phosphate 1-epimerase
MRIEELQERYGVPGRVSFVLAADGAPVVAVTAAEGQALVSLKGAQLLSYAPAGQQDLLWLSPAARLGDVTPIRGGIPVCWPWFASHPTDRKKPIHGFVRNVLWDVAAVDVLDKGARVRIRFEFVTGVQQRTVWPHEALVTLTVDVGAQLALSLETLNTGGQAFALTQALHAYFRVGDITRTAVLGLDRTIYLDKLQNFARKRQTGPVVFDGEVDRIYVDTVKTMVIRDTERDLRIAVNKQGSSSTVVWNPGPQRSAQLGDMGPEGWRRMVCVETANAGDDVIRVDPGGRHVLGAIYGLAPPGML